MENEAAGSGQTNRIWKFFTSVKLTVVLLLSLAATSIIGTLIPQNESPETYFRAFGAVFYRLFDALDLFDMYHSWWFQVLLLLLTMNVVVCSIDRLPGVWKVVRIKKPKFNPERLKNAADRQAFDTDATPDQLKASFAAVTEKSYGYHTLENTREGFALYGEKGRWTRLGVYTVHCSVILLLFGGLIGSIFGFEGFVNIPEGETVGNIRLRRSNFIQPLEFEIRCDDFSISFYDRHGGMPKEFRSKLTLLEKGKPVLTRDIIVNDPLRYKGINIYQASYGEIPSEPPPLEIDTKKIALSIVSRDTGMAYQQTAAVGEALALPEGMGTLVIKEYMESAEFRGQPIGQALIGVLTSGDGQQQQLLLPLRFPKFDRMRQGAQTISVVIPKDAHRHTAADHKVRYFTGLQVTKDPGVWIVYAGFVIMIAGCFITFFMSHQRVSIVVKKSGNKSRVTVSGTANKNKIGMQKRVALLAGRLEHIASNPN